MWWIYRCAACINTKRCATEFEHTIVNMWFGKSLGRSIPSMTPRARQILLCKTSSACVCSPPVCVRVPGNTSQRPCTLGGPRCRPVAEHLQPASSLPPRAASQNPIPRSCQASAAFPSFIMLAGCNGTMSGLHGRVTLEVGTVRGVECRITWVPEEEHASIMRCHLKILLSITEAILAVCSPVNVGLTPRRVLV